MAADRAGSGAEVPAARVSTKLAPFVATLTQALEVDARRTKHERRTARALHVQLTSQGYEGGYTRLTVSNGMDAPTRNGINVPKWKR